MDQMKIGKFIAALRKEKCLTQEQLGEKLGVTNKTVSRWENGNYMPDVEMLALLSKEFGVSINELISGERLLAEDFQKACLLYTSPSPRDRVISRMPSSA